MTWSKTEGVKWALPLPAWSGSTPIVWNDRIFLNVADKENVELWCVNRADGSVRWKRNVSGGNKQVRKQNMSTPSPVTDGTGVWIVSGTGVIKGFDFDGNERWARDLQDDYGLFGQLYGYGSSPLLFEDSLYVQVLHGSHTVDPSYLVRINKTDGKTIWKSDRRSNARQESPDAYTTPTLSRAGGRPAIVVSGADVVTGHDPATGSELWRADRPESDRRPDLSHHRVAVRARRHRVRAVARTAAAGGQGRRQRQCQRHARVVALHERP